MNPFEQSRERLDRLIREPEISSSRNEATTRLQLINYLLFECLGWSTFECVAEEAHAGEYADYTLSAPRPLLILEAKREGEYFDVPAGSKSLISAIPSLVKGNPKLGAAIQQAASYCQSRGVPFAAVSNGHQLVAFVAIRQDQPPLEGRALVFPSMESMHENFLELWNAISKPAIEERLLEQLLLGTSGPEIPPKLSSHIWAYPGTKARNRFQADLKIVSELVLEDVATTPEMESEFLSECYCDSGALSEFSMSSRDMLHARYAALFDSTAPGPTAIPAVTKKGVSGELLAKSLSRRPVLILGDVGAGKTTFLRHLVTVSAAEQFRNAVTLHLDLGSQATLALDLREYVIREIGRQLHEDYGIDIEERGFVRAVYHGELSRFAKGIFGDLHDSDPARFAEHERAFMQEKLLDKAEHIRWSLGHIERGHKKQIVIFLDNADQRSYVTQQQVFLISQEFAEHWPATVFVTLRPETFHLSLRTGGALSGYHPKAFTIAPPRTDRVIEKRLKFGLRLTRGEVSIKALKGVNLQLSTLESILLALLQTLAARRELAELIENIASGNVRHALDLVQQFLGSGHVDTEKIVRIFSEQGEYTVPLHEFLRAVIYGDSEHYDPSRSNVANLFDVSSHDEREHFILPIIISVLADWSGAGVRNGFVETSLLYARIQGLGFRPEQVDAALVRAHRHKMVETSARRTPEPGQEMPPSFRVTSVGLYHTRRLAGLFTYLDAIAVDLPVFDSEVRDRIQDAGGIHARLDRALIVCDYLDDVWRRMPAVTSSFVWPNYSNALRQDVAVIRRRLG